MTGIARARTEPTPRFNAAKIGANLGDPMSNDFSIPPEEDESFVKHTLRLTEEEAKELELIVEFYSELWRLQGRRKKAKTQTVLRRAARNFMSGFWDWLAKGRPGTAEERERIVRAYLEGIAEKLKSEEKKTSGKKK